MPVNNEVRLECIVYMLRVSATDRSRDWSRQVPKHWLRPIMEQGMGSSGWAVVVSYKAGKVVWGQTRVMFSLPKNEEYEPHRRNTESNSH